MSDFASSLPVRTEQNGDVASKIVDGTTPSQALTVNPDGSVNVTDNSGSLTVDATDLDIRDLSHTQDSVKVGDGTDFLSVNADGSINITDNGGSITVDGTVSASNFPSTVDTDYGVVGANTIRTASEIGNATGAANFNYGAVGAQTLRTASQLGNATGAADFNNGATGAQTLRTAANLAVGGTDVSPTNPVPVTVSVNNTGTEVNDYNTASAVAAGATSNHDYTVTALTTLLLTQIEATGSGKTKIEVMIETGVATGVFTSKFVQFNSTATPNMTIHLAAPISVAAGVRVRVARTNKDNQAQDLYSTISGQEV